MPQSRAARRASGGRRGDVRERAVREKPHRPARLPCAAAGRQPFSRSMNPRGRNGRWSTRTAARTPRPHAGARRLPHRNRLFASQHGAARLGELQRAVPSWSTRASPARPTAGTRRAMRPRRGRRRARYRELVVLPLADPFACLAAQDVDQMPGAEALAGAVDRRQRLCAGSVPSQVCGGSRQLSQLPHGVLASPK